MGDSLSGNLPALASLLAPENCRYHAVSKVIGFTDPLAHPFGRPTQSWLTAWAYRLIKTFGEKQGGHPLP